MFDAFMPVFCVLTMEILKGVIPCVMNEGVWELNYAFYQVNPFQPKLILVHTTITGTCRHAYKTCKNWPLCSYVG